MNIIVQNREGRLGSFLALLLLIGIGVTLIHFVGGIMSWVFAVLFFLFALLPLDSFIRPETNILGLNDGILGWCNIKQGKKVDEDSVPVEEIRKIIRSKTSGYKKLAVIDIQLETTSGQTIDLPMYLQLSVHEKKILSVLQEANPAIEIEQKEMQNKSVDTYFK